MSSQELLPDAALAEGIEKFKAHRLAVIDFATAQGHSMEEIDRRAEAVDYLGRELEFLRIQVPESEYRYMQSEAYAEVAEMTEQLEGWVA